MQPIILASQSPRRRELLGLYGIPFVVDPSQADEEHVQGTGAQRVQKLAQLKCAEVAARHPGRMVLAADTLVCVDDEILGKPKDEQDASRMLHLLSGRAHEVHTGVCLRLPDGRQLCGVDTTRVFFLPLSEQSIRRYIATGEPMDKAGAYGIQGRAGIFVSHIEGSPSNVIGLPLGLLTRFLTQAGVDFFET
ncbi:MAG: Maf family protein [Clostridia bacterium]|nr:Maf family protein [Clostridia bacterium]